MLGEQLTTIQKRELNILLKEFKKTLQALPGRSNLTEHSIKTDDSGPIRLPAYRIPHAYHGQVEQEIREMLEYDIIQPSKSDWATPMVIVNKKDGTLRVCVDYRKLNSHSKIDPYPMPRISDFIDQLGEAKYITTLDLTKGYWQVPVKKEDQCKTAPFGLFEFKRMPLWSTGGTSYIPKNDGQTLRWLSFICQCLHR